MSTNRLSAGVTAPSSALAKAHSANQMEFEMMNTSCPMHLPSKYIAAAAGVALAVVLSLSTVRAEASNFQRMFENPKGGWICNAYGRRQGHWVTVTGCQRSTKEEAKGDAVIDCSAEAFACQPSGCWPSTSSVLED